MISMDRPEMESRPCDFLLHYLYFCVFLMYHLCEKCHKPIAVQYNLPIVFVGYID